MGCCAAAFRRATQPLVVDLGHGKSATTSLELHQRLSRVRGEVEVAGIEIDSARVKLAATSGTPDVSFRLGGFEVPLAHNRKATVIRAFTVLRAYDETAVPEAWRLMASRLAPGGVFVEGTCNEVGRVASWADVTADDQQSLTVSLRLARLERPSIIAEQLPKVLIHRNVPGERIHQFLLDLDRHWQFNAALSTYGPSQRWIAAATGLRSEGWPVLGTKSRWTLGELTVAWAAAAPLGFAWK